MQILRAIALAIILLAGTSDSFSQSRRNPPENAAATQKPSAADQRGTDQAPFVVKTIPAPKGHDDAAADAAEKKDKSDSDWSLVILTGVLAILATIQCVIFGWQGWQLKRTVDLGREEFISSNRPFLKIKFVEWTPHDDGSVTMSFGIENVGTTPATVLGSAAYVGIFGPNDWPNPHDYGRNCVIERRKFLPGNTDRYSIKSTEINTLTMYSASNVSVRLYGYVVYADDAKNPRTTYFCRVHDRDRDRFVGADNADYDSAD